MRKDNLNRGIGFLFYLLFFLFWELISRLSKAEYLLPAPSIIIISFFENLPLLILHLKVTIWEAGLGLLIGLLIASALSIAIAYFRFLEIIINPIIIALQTIPKITIAPLFLIWLGFGYSSKIATSALMCLFPILLNFTRGLVEVEQDVLDVFYACRASRKKIFFYARLPNALPSFFTGLKIAIPFSIIGAIVGEFIGAHQGLGYLVMQAQATLDIPLVFAIILCISLSGVFAYKIVSLLEERLIYWHLSKNQGYQKDTLNW